MAPADEGLDADHLGRAQVDIGLVQDEELVASRAADEVGLEGALVEDHGPSVGVRPPGRYIWKALRPRPLARYMASSARLSSSS